MKVFYRDEQDRDQPIWFASYGIGPTRVMGTLVEVFNDDRGIIWPESVAPFQVHLIGLDMEDVEINNKAEEVYNRLKTAGVDVLFDDRNIRAGEKFADADLIGIPLRVVVSKKTEDKIEVRKRPEKETRFISLEELISETGA
jgi:prolyl-tRNA synthetase